LNHQTAAPTAIPTTSMTTTTPTMMPLLPPPLLPAGGDGVGGAGGAGGAGGGGGGGAAVTVGEAAAISLADIATTVSVVPRSVMAVLIPMTMADVSVVNVVAAL